MNKRIAHRKAAVDGCLLAAVGCCIILLAAYLWREVPKAREGIDSSVCLANQSNFHLEMLNYHDKYHRLPPAYIADEHGRPMHSWRILLLETSRDPDAVAIYKAYRFDEPWDGPHNRLLADKMPRFYACHSDVRRRGEPRPNGLSNYVLVTGPGTLFPGKESASLDDIKDIHRDTILVAETLPGVPWLKPQDLEVDRMSFRINDPARPSISSAHPNCSIVALLDGRVERLPETTTPEALRDMILLTPADGAGKNGAGEAAGAGKRP